jgi:hypothetical protein
VNADPARGTDGSRLQLAEYAALRRTITQRGTARMIVAPASCVGWAALAVATGPGQGHVLGSLLPLAVLFAGFEAVHALHTGAERIGRYVQVFHEGWSDGPRWESTAMTVGPALPGGGIDPLFSVVFVTAALLNLLLARPEWSLSTDSAVLVTAHLALVVRIGRARAAASRQRAVELESFRALRSRDSSRE